MPVERDPREYAAFRHRRLGGVASRLRKRVGRALLDCGSTLLVGPMNRARHTLTALPGRPACLATISKMQRAREADDQISVLTIDLDGFRLINATFGPATGDLVLSASFSRLSQVLATRHGVVIHLGSDCFGCIVHHAGDDPLDHLVEQLLLALGEPIKLLDKTVLVGASIGIASDRDHPDPRKLLRAASIAMIAAKQERGPRWQRFDAAMGSEMSDREILGGELIPAIGRREIRPHYQPIVRLFDGELIGFESLARWHHPTFGILPPGRFIPLAEDLDAINELCFSMLSQACRDVLDWPPHVTLSINISPSQICNPDLPLRLLRILRASGLRPERLIVEITETALVKDFAAARASIRSLRAAGVRIALDDFGTGYSNLHHLRELEFDRLKIDRSFIQALDGFAGEKIVRSIISLTGTLGMTVTAEGVETGEQASSLIELGCTYGQGYFLGAPMPSTEAAQLSSSKSEALLGI